MGVDAGPHSRFPPVGRMKRKVWGNSAHNDEGGPNSKV